MKLNDIHSKKMCDSLLLHVLELELQNDDMKRIQS